MADYNIYIHSVDGGGFTNPTSPSSFNGNSFTMPWTNDSDSGSDSGGGVNPVAFMKKARQAPKKVIDMFKSMGKGGKLGAVLGAAYLVLKGCYEAEKIADSFVSVETGDFRHSKLLENYEASKHAVFHPISTTIEYNRTQQRIRLENQRRQMQRELLGDSEINRYSNRGV